MAGGARIFLAFASAMVRANSPPSPASLATGTCTSPVPPLAPSAGVEDAADEDAADEELPLAARRVEAERLADGLERDAVETLQHGPERSARPDERVDVRRRGTAIRDGEVEGAREIRQRVAREGLERRAAQPRGARAWWRHPTTAPDLVHIRG
jgi:hypothetical protein